MHRFQMGVSRRFGFIFDRYGLRGNFKFRGGCRRGHGFWLVFRFVGRNFLEYRKPLFGQVHFLDIVCAGGRSLGSRHLDGLLGWGLVEFRNWFARRWFRSGRFGRDFESCKFLFINRGIGGGSRLLA